MIVKFLSSTGTFAGVQYNTKKILNESGTLMHVANMPHVNGLDISERECKDYFIAHSSTNKNIKNSQFHVTISVKGQELDKYQLTDISQKFMTKMGYGDNPYIVVFHNDTDNNHVHIVSSRVDNNGAKISHHNEGRRARSIINDLEKEYKVERVKDFEQFLNYNFDSKNQLITLLKSHGFEAKSDKGFITIHYNGQEKAKLEENTVAYNTPDKERAKQIKALVSKYSVNYNSELIPIYKKLKGDRLSNEIVGYRSDLSDFMKAKFGIDFIYHFSGNKRPFGYTLIDNAKGNIYKGGDIMKLSLLVNSENISLQKEQQGENNKLMKKINAYNIENLSSLQLLSKYYKVDEYKISLNDHKLSDLDKNYYRVLLDHHFNHDNWANLNKLQIVPILHQGDLLLLDTGNLIIIEANECLDRNIIDEYLNEVSYDNMNDIDTHESNDFDFGWDMADDEDDEMTHGKKRKGKKRR